MKRSELKRGTSQLKRSAMPPREHFINKKSTKTAKRDQLYAKLRVPFLKEHPDCEIKWDERCTRRSTEVHHMAGRAESVFFNQKLWRGGCAHCHQMATVNPTEAFERGHSVHRNAIREDDSS